MRYSSAIRFLSNTCTHLRYDHNSIRRTRNIQRLCFPENGKARVTLTKISAHVFRGNVRGAMTNVRCGVAAKIRWGYEVTAMRYSSGLCFGDFAANGQLEPLSRAKAS